MQYEKKPEDTDAFPFNEKPSRFYYDVEAVGQLKPEEIVTKVRFHLSLHPSPSPLTQLLSQGLDALILQMGQLRQGLLDLTNQGGPAPMHPDGGQDGMMMDAGPGFGVGGYAGAPAAGGAYGGAGGYGGATPGQGYAPPPVPAYGASPAHFANRGSAGGAYGQPGGGRTPGYGGANGAQGGGGGGRGWGDDPW